jgi:hypothetical protein
MGPTRQDHGGFIALRTALGNSLLLLALSGLVAVPATADAATICDAPDTTWIGPATWNGDRSWTLGSNWSDGVPSADSDVCIPAGVTANPLIPAGTTTTVASVDAPAAMVWLDVDGSLTVTGSWEVSQVRVTGGSVTLAGTSVLHDTYLTDGARMFLEGQATLGVDDAVIAYETPNPGLLVLAPSGVLTVDVPAGQYAAVGGALANHGSVNVVSGRLSVLGLAPGEMPADGGSDGSWTAAPGADIWLGGPVLLDGSRLEGVLTYDAVIPSGAVVTASRTQVWPGGWDYPAREPTLTGAGELVLTDDSELIWGVGDHVTVRIPPGEHAALDGWLQDDARVLVEGGASHARGTFAVLDSASLEIAPQGEMSWTDGDPAGWQLPDHPSQPPGTVVVDEGGTLVGGGAGGALVCGVLDNHGTVRAEAGLLRATPSPTNLGDGVLSGGRWEAGAGARLTFLDPGDGTRVGAITANAAEVSLEGAGSSIRGLGALTTNRAGGLIDLGDATSLATTGRFRNAGTVTLDATADLTVAGRLVQSEAATLQVEVGRAAAGGVAAGGQRDLAGTLRLVPDAGSWPPPLRVGRDLITSTGRATPDDAFDVVRALRIDGLKPRVRYGADRVWFRIGE